MPHYLTTMDVMAMNEEILRRMGGESTVRDEGALESAVMRPQMAAHYAEASLVEQAASLIAGIALAPAFVDGNKRTALAAGTSFLIMNGQWIVTKPEELGRQIMEIIERPGSLHDAIASFVSWLNERVGDL